jgi:hypothetical protein
MSQHATAEDFANWTEKAKSMTDSALIYSARDAFQCAKNFDRIDGVVAGRYADEGHTYYQELAKRRASRRG